MPIRRNQISVTRNVFNVRVTDANIEYFIEEVLDVFPKETVNIMSINGTSLYRFDREMFSFTEKFDFITADGNGLVRLSGFLGARIKNQIPISTLSEKILANVARMQFRVFLLGANEINNSLAQRTIRKRHPELIVSGHHGYFKEEKFCNVIKLISQFKPDIILVGMSSPKKEQIILKIAKHYSPSINIACGGYLDILAGKITRAPVIIQRLSLEWVYRFLQEPKRLFKPMIIGGLIFLFRIIPRAFYYSRIKKRQVDLYKITQ